jgi:N-acetylneuraminic acid mutarotase
MEAPNKRAGYAERTGASMTAIDGRLYIFGGQEPQTGVCFNDVIVFDPATGSWHRAMVAGGR